MKWNDSGETNDPEENKKEDFFDEERYSPWALSKDSEKVGKINRGTILLCLVGFAVLTSVTALLMLLFGSQGESPDKWQMALLQERVAQLEERLSRYDAIDEKVTHIWEQARAFEKFKERFERGEASLTLRMDDITAAVDKLHKKGLEPALSGAAQVVRPGSVQPPASTGFHIVAAGDTFYNISKRYHMDMDHLLELNGLKKGSILKLGQKLVVNNGPAREP
jgi:LysM repeat protein